MVDTTREGFTDDEWFRLREAVAQWAAHHASPQAPLLLLDGRAWSPDDLARGMEEAPGEVSAFTRMLEITADDLESRGADSGVDLIVEGFTRSASAGGPEVIA
jgi:hypothetical protein